MAHIYLNRTVAGPDQKGLSQHICLLRRDYYRALISGLICAFPWRNRSSGRGSRASSTGGWNTGRCACAWNTKLQFAEDIMTVI
jgi:hypothetical protein